MTRHPLITMSLRSKISLRLTLLVGAALLATGACSLLIAKRTVEERISFELRSAAKERARTVDHLLQSRISLARMLALEHDVVLTLQNRGPVPELQNTFLRIQEAVPALAHFALLDATNRVRFATSGEESEEQAMDLTAFPWIEAEGGVRLRVIAPAAGQRTHLISVPVRTGDRRALGTLIAEFDLRSLYSLLQWDETIGRAGGHLITDLNAGKPTCIRPEGVTFSARRSLLSQNKKADVVGFLAGQAGVSPKAGAATPLCDIASSGYEGVFTGSLDGVGAAIAAHAMIPDMGIGVIAYIQREEAFRPMGLLLATLIGTTAVLFLLVAFISIRLSHEVVDPILHLRRSLEQLDTGHWTHEAHIHSGDELEILDREVARLALRLGEAYGSLEERVRGRTEELAEAHSRDEALLESIGDGVLAIDMTGKILLCNQSAEEILQWKRADILGSHFGSCLPLRSGDGRLLPQSEHLIERALRDKCTVRTTPQRTYHCGRKDGVSFPLALTAMPFLIGMEIKGIVVTFRDITEEKRVDRMKSEFISIASHQLRTPLTAIGWYIELLQKEAGERLSLDQRDYIAQVIDSHHRMVMLVNSLLNVSRIELGRLKIDPEQTDVLRLVADTVKELRPQIEERRLQFKSHLPGKVDAFVDSRLVQIVLENLLSNAIKYTPTGGAVELRLVLDPEEMRFEVRDTGYGIPRQQQQRIFEKLFRADNVQKTDTVGTGLGLYIAKFSVEAWGGKIWFESDEGHGATFCFTVPRTMRRVEVTQKTIEYDALTPP